MFAKGKTPTSWLITLLVPLALVLSVVRLLLTPLFIQLEYHMPYFPADPYGFSLEERLYWSELSRQYLLNDEDITFLSNLRFEDGSPVFNERELRHMEDVKVILKRTMTVLVGAWLVLTVRLYLATRHGWLKEYRQAVSRGGWLTVGVIGAIVAFSILSFNTFFIKFHRLFFEGDTWLFAYSDTLIRLFPERFWMDTFLVVGVLSLIGGCLLGWLFRQRQRI
ncbi:MAG: TIGR01906 family membrane protein [Chloroflexota bacterium]